MGTSYKKERLITNNQGTPNVIRLSDAEMSGHKERVLHLLQSAVDEGVQEITLISGEYPDFKAKGVLEKKLELPLWSDDDFNYFLSNLTRQVEDRPIANNELDTRAFEHLMDTKGYSYDFAVNLKGKTLRMHAVSIYNPQAQPRKEKYCFTIRVVPTEIPTWKSLHLPKVFSRFEILKSGLILISGHTGSGKSTTVATLVNNINKNPNHRKTILTIEEPVEFVHKPSHSSIIQRCVGINVASYTQATNDALRENVDVVVIGELRTAEEMDNAIRLAEVGKLVIATVHSNSPADTVDRIVNSFSGDLQDNVRSRLSENVVGILHQNLEVIKGEQIPVASGFIIESPSNKSKLRKDFTRTGISTLIKDNPKTWCVSQKEAYEELVETDVIKESDETEALLVQVK